MDVNTGITSKVIDTTSTEPHSFNLQRPIRVFISSKCGDGDEGRFDPMRKELASQLDESLIFQAYLWERGGASTEQAEARYLSELKDSDVIVIVIDNKVGVTPGVRKEIDSANRLGKRCLYYFCSELEKEKTPLQDQLTGANGATYKTVERMGIIPSQVIHDLQEDIFTRYREWCNHDIVSIGEQPNTDLSPIRVVDDTQLPKEAISRLPGLVETVRCFLFDGTMDLEPDEGIDAEASRLAKSLFLDTTIGSFGPKGIVDVVRQLLPEDYAAVIDLRWGGIHHYLNGDSSSAIRTLDDALEMAREKGLESWLVDDILIDLRNIRSGMADATMEENAYQIQLSSSGHDISYPLLDRAISDALEELEKDRFKTKTGSYGTVTYGNNINGLLEPICKAFAIAACFGSLTHISLTVRYLKALVFYLCSKYQDSRLNATLLKLSIVSGKRGDGEKTIQSFNDMCFDNDSSAAKDIFDFCANYRCLNDSSAAIFEAFGLVGCYMDQADFTRSEALFINRAEALLLDSDPWEPNPASVFNAMRINASRLDISWMVDYSVRAIGSGRYFWCKEALNFIMRTDMNYSMVDARRISEMLDALDGIAKETQDGTVQDYICSSLSSLSESLEDEWRPRLDAVAEELPDSLLRRYKDIAGHGFTDKGLIDLIEESLKRIQHSNERQGTNGAFSFGADEHGKASTLLVRMEKPSSELAQRLYDACLDTICNPNYDCTGKVQACEALCRMLVRFGVDALDPAGRTKLVVADKTPLLQGQSFRNENIVLLSVWVDTVSLLVGYEADVRLYTSLARCYRDDEYTQANAGRAVRYLLEYGTPNLSPTLMGFVFSYACYLTKSMHFQLNIRGIEILTKFLHDKDFQAPAAQALFDAYIGQSPRGKQVIIDSIDDIRAFDDRLAEELRSVVLRDNTTTAVAHLKRIESK